MFLNHHADAIYFSDNNTFKIYVLCRYVNHAKFKCHNDL